MQVIENLQRADVHPLEEAEGFKALHEQYGVAVEELAAKTGRAPDELVEDAMAGHLAELVEVRQMLDSRYGEIKSGRVKPIDGDENF